MNNPMAPNELYGPVQIMMIDYWFRLWLLAFGKKSQPTAQARPEKIADLKAITRQIETELTPCGC